MMARPCVVALLCVALWCGLVLANEGDPATAAPAGEGGAGGAVTKSPAATTKAAPAAPAAAETTTASSDEEASKDDKDNGVAMVSVSLPALMIVTALAKLYAH